MAYAKLRLQCRWPPMTYTTSVDEDVIFVVAHAALCCGINPISGSSHSMSYLRLLAGHEERRSNKTRILILICIPTNVDVTQVMWNMVNHVGILPYMYIHMVSSS
ncbi:hypothetical protein K449DRAFT_83606 [Hypoxylon sp. EC38]|nr:hypothetical protein K449DRAFT_83606 [Hypoxylon sp. EC38]